MTRIAKATDHSAASASIFVNCTPKQRHEIESLSTPVEVKAGYVLVHEGAIGHEFGVIIEGTAAVTIAGRLVATLGPGDHYGEVALLDEIGHTDGRRMATVTAETDLWVSVMTIREFRTLLADIPEVATVIEASAVARLNANPPLHTS